MTLADLRTETFRRLRDDAGAPVFWTEAEVDAALNAGYMEVSDETEWHEVAVTIDLLSHRPWYDLRRLVGPGFLAIGQGYDLTTNRWLLPTTVRELDAYDRRWERAVGEPRRVVMQGLWWVGYWPRIGSDTGTIQQYVRTLPDPLVDAADEPGFPETWHYGLVEYAVSDLSAQDGEASRAQLAWAAYLAQEAGLRAWVDGRASAALMHGYGGVAGRTES